MVYCTMLLIMSPYYFYLVGSHAWIFEVQSIHIPFESGIYHFGFLWLLLLAVRWRNLQNNNDNWLIFRTES